MILKLNSTRLIQNSIITAESVKIVILQFREAVSKTVKIAANSGTEDEGKEETKAEEKETIGEF